MASWPERLGGLAATALPGGLELREATGWNARRRGLSGVDGLPPDVALRIHRCSSVQTLHMRFALDLVWLGADGRVLRVDLGVPPRRLRRCRGARAVIETAAGSGRAFAEALESAGLTDTPSLHN